MDILAYQVLIHRIALLLIEDQHLGQILPASGCDKGTAVRRILHFIEEITVDIQKVNDGGMQSAFHGVLLKGIEIRLHRNDLKTVHYGHIKFPYRLIKFGRVTCGHYDPAIRHSVPAENLILQELQHGRSKGLGHAVDLVEEKNTLRYTALLHSLINRHYDLTHGILGHIRLYSVKDLTADHRKTYR